MNFKNYRIKSIEGHPLSLWRGGREVKSKTFLSL
jgi:hypothetical protein